MTLGLLVKQLGNIDARGVSLRVAGVRLWLVNQQYNQYSEMTY